MLVLHNASQIVTVDSHGASSKRGSEMREIGVREHASLVIESDKISAILPSREIQFTPYDEVVDCTGKVILPGFVDSHTHAVFATARAEEFAMRIEGKSYQEIAAAGGGIANSMRGVRAATKESLEAGLRERLHEMFRHGTTTAEVKSGYGLNCESELKMLEAIKDAHSVTPVEIHPTFLGAHAVPPEYIGRQPEYVDYVINDMLPEIGRRNLAEYCDVFCDDGYFTAEESVRIFNAAKQFGMRPKVHADELAETGGAAMAARVGALSADHLLCVSNEGIAAMKSAGVVATLLPGTAYFLGVPYAPVRTMIDAGLAVALATDFNPGTSPVCNMQMVLSLACTQMRMTVEEAITAATINAHAALGLSQMLGSLEAGKQADAVVFDLPNYHEIAYWFGGNLVKAVVKRGKVALAGT